MGFCCWCCMRWCGTFRNHRHPPPTPRFEKNGCGPTAQRLILVLKWGGREIDDPAMQNAQPLARTKGSTEEGRRVEFEKRGCLVCPSGCRFWKVRLSSLPIGLSSFMSSLPGGLSTLPRWWSSLMSSLPLRWSSLPTPVLNLRLKIEISSLNSGLILSPSA
jgi:hypothetical protein